MNETEIYNIFARFIQTLPKFDLVGFSLSHRHTYTGKYPNIVCMIPDKSQYIMVIRARANSIEQKLIEIVKKYAATWGNARNREEWTIDEYAVAAEVGCAYKLFCDFVQAVEAGGKGEDIEIIRNFLDNPERLMYMVKLNLYADQTIYEPINFYDKKADIFARRFENILKRDNSRDEDKSEVLTDTFSYSLRLSAAAYELYKKKLITVGFRVETNHTMLNVLDAPGNLTVMRAIVPVGFMMLTEKSRKLLDYIFFGSSKNELRRRALHAIDKGDVDSAIIMASLDQ